jgi:hypothetical protein
MVLPNTSILDYIRGCENKTVLQLVKATKSCSVSTVEPADHTASRGMIRSLDAAPDVIDSPQLGPSINRIRRDSCGQRA